MFFGTVLNYSVGKETSVKFKCQVQVSSSSAKFKCQVQEQREKSQDFGVMGYEFGVTKLLGY